MRSLFINVFFILLLSVAGCAQNRSVSGNSSRQDLTASEVKQLVETKKEMVILDVRTPEEFGQGHITGAQNINFYAPDFEQQLGKLDTSGTYLLYCASGNRSGKTAALLEGKKFKRVYNSKAGFNELKQAGVPAR